MDFIKNEWTSESEKILVCPVCEFKYTHLIKVTEFRSNVISESRLGAVLSFECENGHLFEYRFHNHEGYTVGTVDIPKK